LFAVIVIFLSSTKFFKFYKVKEKVSILIFVVFSILDILPIKCSVKKYKKRNCDQKKKFLETVLN